MNLHDLQPAQERERLGGRLELGYECEERGRRG